VSCDRSRTHVWKPLLHSIAAGSLKRSQDELDYPAPQAHWSHFRYRDGEMIGLDRAAKTITLANYARPPASREIIAYGLDKIDPERDYSAVQATSRFPASLGRLRRHRIQSERDQRPTNGRRRRWTS
jgi:hypothetical protein